MQYNGSPSMSPRPARGTLRSFSIVQHNSLESWDVFLSLMNSISQLASPPMIVALQDPPVRRGQLPSFSTYRGFHPSFPKPRVAFYIHPHLLNSVSLLPGTSTRSDLFSIDIFAPDGFFELQFTRFRIINAYNLPLKSAPFRTIAPPDLFQDNAFPTMLVGDLNLHHPAADPLRTFDSREYNLSHPYYSQASEHGYSLLNQPGLYTYFPFAHNARPSVLDLAFANSPLFPSFSHWDTPLPLTGSDHVPVLITLESPRFRLPPPSPNWSKTDWSRILPNLPSLIPPPPPSVCSTSTFEEWFDTHANKVKTLISSNTPVSRPSPRSKPWWSPLLSHLRSAFHAASRTYRSSRDSYDQSALRSARRSYFTAIKKAKFAHWSTYLSSLTPSSVWEDRKLASGRQAPRFPSFPDQDTPEGINEALLSHFFPSTPLPTNAPSTLSPYPDYFPLSQGEITLALSKSSNTSAPGPDTVSYDVWKRVHRSCPALLTKLLSPLLHFGHHPASLKKANGIVLDKPGKASYDTPASFRVIVLLETLSKILERVIASRLSLLARHVGLLHPHQTGSLPGLSTFDATSTLAHEVRLLQRLDSKVSSLFLDIKGGFDNVDPGQLTSALRAKGAHKYLTAWVGSFLTNRRCRLLFQGSPRIFSPVAVGTPQGSPISPLLFVIYVSPLHPVIPKGIVISYVDDFVITVSSSSHRRNVQLLQGQYRSLCSIAAPRGLTFSVPKTELIHWRTPQERSPPSTAGVRLDDLYFPPKDTVRWLGYWFTPPLSSSAHFSKRLSLAQGAFDTIKRLSPPGKGLPPYLCHRLASSLLAPVLLYGADLYTPLVRIQDKLDVFWHRVQRWVTNCFSSTPVPILAIESCLPPLVLLIEHRQRMAALRMVCSPPEINPASARLHRSVPNRSSYRSPLCHRSLLVKLNPAHRPLMWKTPQVTIRKHLPIDEITHRTLPLLKDRLFFPSHNRQLVPTLSVPPPDPPSDSYNALKKESRAILLLQWRSLAPPPPGYPYPPSLTPHSFMGLPKFMAGRFHQMRSGKSYLAAHPSWFNRDTPSLCPRCHASAETFEHAILHCEARRRLKESLLPALTSLDAASPLWSSDQDIAILSRFIALTATGFPPDMFPPSPASSAAHSPAPSPSFSPSPRFRFSPAEDD